jgi:hypothetical protein
VSSIDDLAIWLQVQLRGEGPAGSGIGADVIAASHASAVDTDPNEPSDHGLPCHGYALGWRLCRFDGHLLYLHGGSYTGSRSLIAFAPSLKVGIAVVSNSDNLTGWLTGQTVRQFFEYLLDDAGADRHAASRQRGYAERVAKREAALATHLQEGHADAQWAGWAWRPAFDELAEYLGDYASDDPRRPARIARQGQTLVLQIHARQETLTPAQRDLFGSRPHPAGRHEPLAFERDENGRIVGFRWQKHSFARRDE